MNNCRKSTLWTSWKEEKIDSDNIQIEEEGGVQDVRISKAEIEDKEEEISEEELEQTIKKLKKRKTAGEDELKNDVTRKQKNKR